MSSSGCSLSLSNERKSFQEEIALVPRVDVGPFGDTSGVPGGLHATYASIYRKMHTVSLCGMFGARSSSDTDHNISRKECVTVVDAWGSRWRRERCSGWWYRVMRCNSFSRTSRGS